MSTAKSLDSDRLLTGVLHMFVAFDWGDEIDLEHARTLSTSEKHALPRKARTPPSIGYHPAPLRARQPPVSLTLAELGRVSAELDVTLFDFGAVSAAVHVPICVSADVLRKLAGSLCDPSAHVEAVQQSLNPLFESLRPAIHHPVWSPVAEEYFVFQLEPVPDQSPAILLDECGAWIAGIVHLEADPLSSGEIAEALRLRLGYSPNDLFVPDWAATLIVDQGCEELLEVIAFANVQLLEFRHIDARLGSRLQETYRLIHELARSWLPFWRSHARSVRAVGELKVEVNVMLERSGNALKLVGDPYIARVYHALAARLHLDEWGANIRSTLAILEGTYQVLANQTAIYRAEMLEIAIIALILIEIVMAFVRGT